jgi:hypothetical protein
MYDRLESAANQARDPFGQCSKVDRAMLKCIPDFFAIMPPRSGSTWLFENLIQHPEIYIPPMKEVKYFSNYWNMCDINWYLSCFKKGSNKKKGEVSPSYSILPDQMIQTIKNIAPNLRIIIIFRDPIGRMWSHAKHQFRLKESVFAFCDDVYENIPEEKFIECLTNTWTIAYSDYLSIVRRWMALFPREDIHVNFFDSIIRTPRRLLEELFEHIGVSINVDWSLFPLHKKVNQGIKQEIPIKIKEFLLSFYCKKIKEFADFLLNNFSLKIPESWEYITDIDRNNKGIEPYNLYFSNDNNQILLKDILLRESIQSTHVQVLKEDYKGFKIIAFRGECLAISKVLDGIDIIQMSKSNCEKFKREGRILCGETLNEVLGLINTMNAVFSKKRL